MTERTSVREVFFAPLLLTSIMVACGLITGELADVSSTFLYAPYFSTSLAITFVSLLLTAFWWVLNLARTRADAPLLAVKEKLRTTAVYLLLPGILLPLFLVSFTVAKTSIPFLVGYKWDPFLAHADRLIFGDDAWRIAHQWLGDRPAASLEWFYCVVWGIGLFFVMALLPLNSSPKFVGKVYTAMMLAWLVGGFLLAYLFSSAGPVFAHLVNSDPTDQFRNLRAILDSSLTPAGPIRGTQTYLASALDVHVAVKGGGISAMPSMHIAAPSIFVLAAQRTRWFVPSVVFWLIIFVGSAYFGYHYWVDGLVAALVAVVSWAVAEPLIRISAPGFRFGAPAMDPSQPATEV